MDEVLLDPRLRDAAQAGEEIQAETTRIAAAPKRSMKRKLWEYKVVGDSESESRGPEIFEPRTRGQKARTQPL